MTTVDDIKDAEIVQEPVDARNAETTTDIGMALQIYQKVGIEPFRKDTLDVLAKYQTASPDNHLEERYDILPTGELYLPQVQYRRILNEAFGQGGWSMVPMDPKPWVQGDEERRTSQLVQSWALIAHGRYVSEATGGAEYDPKNSRMLWSDACETVKSNAIMRLCKDLGLAGDCWDRRYIQAWKKKFAVAVWVAKWSKPSGQWKVEGSMQWRRIDAEPLNKEIRPVAAGETKITLDGQGNEVHGGKASKGSEKPLSKAAESESQPAAPMDEDRTPLVARAQRAGHGGYFGSSRVVITKIMKNPNAQNGKPYLATTDNGETFSTFSSTDAKAIHAAIEAKRPLDMQFKAAQKGERWYINLEEIVEQEA